MTLPEYLFITTFSHAIAPLYLIIFYLLADIQILHIFLSAEPEFRV